MLSKPDGDYNYIGHVVDHFSKFRILFPMKGKSANEFASNFFRRFLATFGLPKILHSDNGAEYINHVMDAVAVIWPGEVSFVHGKPRHSQSQGLVEQGNNTIQVMISAREKESQTSTWSEWLPEIQCKCSYIYIILVPKYLQIQLKELSLGSRMIFICHDSLIMPCSQITFLESCS